MIAYRSRDKGTTWTGPATAWNIPYNQHGFVPLVPRGSKRIYAFGTEPFFDKIEARENAPIGFRFSDDDGLSWSRHDHPLEERSRLPRYVCHAHVRDRSRHVDSRAASRAPI